MTQPTWPWPHPPPDLSLTMGRLLERSEATVERLDRIDRRLETGEERMDQISGRLAALETTKAPHGQREVWPPMPPWERVLKSAFAYLVVLATLAATGSIETALKFLDAVLKILAALTGGK